MGTVRPFVVMGNYMNFGKIEAFGEVTDGPLGRWDSVGVWMGRFGDVYAYNPVTVEWEVHWAHANLLDGDSTMRALVIASAERLLALQETDGAFRYYVIPFQPHGSAVEYKPGWVSGLAQGAALSAFGRAYTVTKDQRFLNAAAKAFQFMTKPVADGGTTGSLADIDPSLSEYITIEEYPAKPINHALAGAIYALLGVYEWWQLDPVGNADAGVYFNRVLDSIRHLLPYYDIDGWTTYDLAHITDGTPLGSGINPSYQRDDIGLMYALWTITGDPEFRYYFDRWRSYVR
jgi:heparosan-N-sulfate-glucuronate 5-epimerase